MKPRDNCIYCLVEREEKIRDLDAYYLIGYLENGYATYLSADEAEEGRQRGDAYDNPAKTRVVGFKVAPFLAKKRKTKRKRHATGGNIAKYASPSGLSSTPL